MLREGTKGRAVALAAAAAAVALAVPAVSAAGEGESHRAAATALPDFEKRGAALAPTAAQRAVVERLGARATWNRYGTPHTLVRDDGFLGSVQAASAEKAARAWLARHAGLFRLADATGLRLVADNRLPRSNGHAVLFRQDFGPLVTLDDAVVTVGVVGTQQGGWRIAFVSSTLTGERAVAGAQTLGPREAWLAAAANVGRGMSALSLSETKRQGAWHVFRANGLAQPQRVRLGAFPTTNGVRRAYETLFADVRGGQATAYRSVVDAATGEVLARQNLVFQSHDAASTFTGALASTDGACADSGPWTVGADESTGSVGVVVTADVPTNDVVLHLVRDGAVVASQDTLFSPEALVYDPPDEGRGTYHVRTCDYGDGAGWDEPRTFGGSITFSPVGGPSGIPYPPRWRVFPASGRLGAQTFPWSYPSDDIRELWCWENAAGCDRAVGNLASRAPWDANARTGTPTFTTAGNNAVSGEAWTSPLTPGATGFRPVSLERAYDFPWRNSWHESKCGEAFVPGVSHDISAAVTNLFAMHNRMHDWAYHLGFTESAWNAQESNFGTGGTAEGDPVIGNAQAGGLTGGAPSYLGRDNANMVPLPDGVPPITNMYLWQPLAGGFYAPCVDGDYDMAVIGHEYGHLIENRMIGKGGTRGGHHAGAMGESSGDLLGMEILNEYGFVPVSDENPYAVGVYATGNKQRAIRSYGMNFPRTGAFPTPSVSLVGDGARVNPLNFSNLGFDLTGPQVHADGEIWSAVNFDIRRALTAKYDGAYPSSNIALQRDCAEGKRAPETCPGNRRWVQLMLDAYLLMPVAPTMLQARDAYLAADRMRFGGANQAELWLAFAQRGFGEDAASTNAATESDVDPRPDFASPLHGEATVTFRAVASDEGGAEIRTARIFVGHYEARTSPVADTDPATSGPNLDATAAFVPGVYELVAQAPGYGHVRFRVTLAANKARTITVSMPTNRASAAKGAVAAGDGADHGRLVDDTEATAWDRTNAVPDVRGSTVTVDLQGGVQTVNRVQVSALIEPGQNRFTALRQFEIRTCNAAVANCIPPALGFTTVYTSPADAFPGFNPRPVAPELILRSFPIPQTKATHVQIRVLTNQCTGNPAFQGEQDADPLNVTDCRTGSPGTGPVPIFGDLPQVLAPRAGEVHVAELQVFGRAGGATG